MHLSTRRGCKLVTRPVPCGPEGPADTGATRYYCPAAPPVVGVGVRGWKV